MDGTPTTRELALRIRAIEEARVIQAKELERRLEEANNAIARADAERNRVVSRELFDKTIADMQGQRSTLLAGINERIDGLRTWRDTVNGGLLLLRFGAVSGVIALILYILRLAGIGK
jgi:hypothetical protein